MIFLVVFLLCVSCLFNCFLLRFFIKDMCPKPYSSDFKSLIGMVVGTLLFFTLLPHITSQFIGENGKVVGKKVKKKRNTAKKSGKKKVSR